LADEWDEHSRLALDDVERHVFNPVNYFLMTKHFAVDWQQAIDQYFSTQNMQRMPLLFYLKRKLAHTRLPSVKFRS